MLIDLVASNGDQIKIEDNGCGDWVVSVYGPTDVGFVCPKQRMCGRHLDSGDSNYFAGSADQQVSLVERLDERGRLGGSVAVD